MSEQVNLVVEQYDNDTLAEANDQLAMAVVRLYTENAKLVDVLHEVEDEAVLAFNSLRQDCETITDSSQHFFEKWWHAECKIDSLKTENAKLQKMVLCLLTCANDTGDCDRCPLNGGAGDWDSEDFCDGLLDHLREVGIEVDHGKTDHV